jgi:hypothetical protein
VDLFKQIVNSISSPVVIFTASIGVFALFVSFPRVMTSAPVALGIAAASIGFFVVGLTDEHFRTIVTLPDNVPIVAMLFIFGFFTWYAMRKAVVNDMRIEKGSRRSKNWNPKKRCWCSRT